MSLLGFLMKNQKNNSASIAKERLQIIVAHQRMPQSNHDYLSPMREELLAVVARYLKIDPNQVKIEMEHQEDCSVLELNIILPNQDE